MNMLIQFAIKNFLRQGLRSILNVLITAITIVTVIFNLSLLNGFQARATLNMVKTDVAGGHYRIAGFDLLSPTEWEDHTGLVPDSLKALPEDQKAETLILQGQIFPNNRLYPVQMRGVGPGQELLDLPLQGLKRFPEKITDQIPVVIGTKMAERTHLKQGDSVVLKWRDKFGAVDARDILVVDVVKLLNPRVDEGMVWLRLDHLQDMARREGEVSWVAVELFQGPVPDMEFHSVDDLMKDLLILLKNDRRNSIILWIILMFLAGISVFNTQILNVFKRQKEIGTLLALGVESKQVVRIFTWEGAVTAGISVVVAGLIAVPLFMWFQTVGLDVSHLEESTIPVRDAIFLEFNPFEIFYSITVVVALTILVAWLPVRKISHMDPTLALRGKAIT